MAERVKASGLRDDLINRLNQRNITIGKRIPMLATQDVALVDLVCIEQVETSQENVLGTLLPVLGESPSSLVSTVC